MNPLDAVLNLLANLAILANTPEGRALLGTLIKPNPTPAEIHAAIAALPRPAPPPEPPKGGA